MLLRRIVLLVIVPGAAAAAQNAPPAPAPIRIDVKPFTIPEPGRTRWFQVADGMMGQKAAAKLGRGIGIDWKQFMTGAAYAMRFAPDGGPDCRPRKPDPKVELWTIDADPNLSRMAINASTQTGLLFVRGVVKRYVQASDFCTSKRFTQTATDPGFLYVPFGAMGWSLRNFTATALAPITPGSAAAGGPRIAGIFAGPEISVRLGGYVGDMFGHSQALGEGPGSEVTAGVLEKYVPPGSPAAAAIADMPGLVPGAKSEGWLDLNLSDKPATAIGGDPNASFLYLHVRVTHTGGETQPGPGYRWLQELVRDDGNFFTDPARPTGVKPGSR